MTLVFFALAILPIFGEHIPGTESLSPFDDPTFDYLGILGTAVCRYGISQIPLVRNGKRTVRKRLPLLRKFFTRSIGKLLSPTICRYFVLSIVASYN